MDQLSDAERAALTTRLARFEARWDEIALGESVASVNESNGAGGSGVSYSRADRASLDAEIRDMRRRLGLSALERHRSHRPVVVALR